MKSLSATITASQAVALWRKKNPEKAKALRELYYEKRKADPERHKEYLLKNRKWDKNYITKHGRHDKPYGEWTEEKKLKHHARNKIWVAKNPEKRKQYDKKAKNNSLFGGLRELVIQRDGEKCLKCGITRAEHYLKYKRDITVDHINRLGRGVTQEQKDNRMENMQTLCISCHMKKDGVANV